MQGCKRTTIYLRQREGIDAAKCKGKYLEMKVIIFPDKWETYYSLWAESKISASEFRNKVHLKKTTFYKLVKNYKEEMQNE